MLGKRKMCEKTLTLPFVTKTAANKEDLSFSAELACIVCLAESQRKKPSFLRDTQEKISFLAKVYYPMWVLPAENSAVIIDGFKTTPHEFKFEQPNKTVTFIEAFKKSSVDPQKFMDALKAQAKEAKNFSSPVNLSFPALLDDKELLDFFPVYLQSGSTADEKKTDCIPAETDVKIAAETTQTYLKSLRIMEADAKGLKYALTTLKEELDFHTNAATSEIGILEEKLEAETAVLKPVVEKTVNKLTQKHDKAMVIFQKSIERKASALDKRREMNMRKLQVAEQRKDTTKEKIEGTKRKKNAPKSSSGSFALKKYEREVDNIKKEIKAVSDEIEKFKKLGENSVRQKNEEFQKTVATEEGKLTQLNNTYKAKISEREHQIEEMTTQAAAITSNLENRINDLKSSGNLLRSQVEVDFKLEDPETPICLQLPIYLTKFVKSNEERYSVVSPIAIAENVGALNGLKQMFSLNPDPKLKVLTRPASKKLQETLTEQLVNKIQNDAAFRMRINELCQSSNLIDRNIFGQTLNDGLDEIERKGWMTHEEASSMCRHVIGEQA